MLSKIGGLVLVTIALYYLTITVTLKFFLSGVVFLAVPLNETNENRSFLVKSPGAEAIIREYRSGKGSKCAIYFPGQHGGIARYEREVFSPAVDRGITIYAISYPGHEGAGGKATFESVKVATKSAIEYIDKKTSCEISQSVFIGRSLGSAIAMENALIFNPRGLLLDSASPSLGPVITEKMKNSVFLWPAQYLPIDKLLEFDVNLQEGFSTLSHTPIVIFQGKQDKIAKLRNIQEAVKGRPNIELIVLDGASHSNAVLEAGELYFTKLCQLLGCKT